VAGVPIPEGLGGGNPGCRECDHAREGGNVGKRIDLLPASHPNYRATQQKEGYVGADFCRQQQALGRG
jgi:hypothetical protein